ncbi:MAG: hypothetical protein Q4F57_08010, partial [Weeksellaceae bacterium]|nr:hypothetical protein [Weeksellaceae bacterium]
MKKRIVPTKLVIFALMIVSLSSACKTVSLLPTVQYNQYEIGKSFSFSNDTLNITLDNTLHCPLKVWFFSSDERLQKEFN